MSRSFAVHLVSLKSSVSHGLMAPAFWITMQLRATLSRVGFRLWARILRGHAASPAIVPPMVIPNNFSNSRRVRLPTRMDFSPCEAMINHKDTKKAAFPSMIQQELRRVQQH